MSLRNIANVDLDWIRIPGIRRRESTILNLFATLYFYLGLALLFPLFSALAYGEDLVPFLATIVLVFSISIPILVLFKSGSRTRPMEAVFVVGTAWIFAMIIGAIPYVLSGMAVIDSLFESMSGFTTTGATIITDFDRWSKSLYMWRSFTQWLGGAGIIMIFVSIFPMLGVGGRNLFKNEFPGLDVQNLTDRIRVMGIRFHRIYFIISVVQVLLLLLAGLSLYDSIVVMFSTMSTGGFSPHPESIAYYGSEVVQWIVIIFMFLAGTNFYVHYRAWTMRDIWTYVRSTEWVMYFTIAVLGIIGLLWSLDTGSRLVFWIALLFLGLALSVFYLHQLYYKEVDESERHRLKLINVSFILMFIIVALLLVLSFDSPVVVENAIRDSAFQAVSIMTSTGYATVDYVALWPTAALMVLMILTFIGGSTGSTGGGFKTARLFISTKIFYRSLEKMVHPRAIFSIKLDGNNLSEETLSSVLAMLLAYISMVVLGSVAMVLMGVPMIESVTSMFATLSNTGPGLGAIGPYGSYAWMPEPAKLLLILTMWAGRLELMTVFVLFTPVFWKEMLRYKGRN